MDDYKTLIKRNEEILLRSGSARAALKKTTDALRAARNELCILCRGDAPRWREKNCEGCRWRI